MFVENPSQSPEGRRLDFSSESPLLQETSGLPDIPFVGVKMHLHQFLVWQFREIHSHREALLSPAVSPDPTRLAVQDLASADIRVVPIDGIQGSVRTNLHVKSKPLRIVGHRERAPKLGITCDIPGAFPFNLINQHPMHMDITHEELLPVFLGELVCQVESCTPMCRGVAVIRNGLNVVVNVRVEMTTCLPVVAPALNDVKHVWNDAGSDERLTVLIKIESPGITGAIGKYLELFIEGVVAPHPGVDLLALTVRSTGLADIGMSKDPMSPV